MQNQQPNTENSKYLMIAKILGIITLIVSCSIILGWIFNPTLLKSISPHWVSTKSNTAICFIMLSIALILASHFQIKKLKVYVEKILLFFVISIAALTLLQSIVNINFNIDQWLFSDIQHPYYSPGRMAPIRRQLSLPVGVN